jgi:Ca2+-binding RTX toxin-like protein
VAIGDTSVTGTTDENGTVTLPFTPDAESILVSAVAAGFNERLRGFGFGGPIDEGTPVPEGFGGGIGGLCPGLESVLGTHIVGGGGANTLTGTPGRDVMCGGAGNDVIRAFEGGDFVAGGPGDDVVGPGDGDDDAFGNEGTDLLDYADLAVGVRVDLRGGSSSGAGADTIGGFESARGGRRNDRLRGTEAGNRLVGGKGRDRLSGMAERDRLAGGPGKDRLVGGKGKDRLRGGPGRDMCRGGPGKDRARRCERP